MSPRAWQLPLNPRLHLSLIRPGSILSQDPKTDLSTAVHPSASPRAPYHLLALACMSSTQLWETGQGVPS